MSDLLSKIHSLLDDDAAVDFILAAIKGSPHSKLHQVYHEEVHNEVVRRGLFSRLVQRGLKDACMFSWRSIYSDGSPMSTGTTSHPPTPRPILKTLLSTDTLRDTCPDLKILFESLRFFSNMSQVKVFGKTVGPAQFIVAAPGWGLAENGSITQLHLCHEYSVSDAPLNPSHERVVKYFFCSLHMAPSSINLSQRAHETLSDVVERSLLNPTSQFSALTTEDMVAFIHGLSKLWSSLDTADKGMRRLIPIDTSSGRRSPFLPGVCGRLELEQRSQGHFFGLSQNVSLPRLRRCCFETYRGGDEDCERRH